MEAIAGLIIICIILVLVIHFILAVSSNGKLNKLVDDTRNIQLDLSQIKYQLKSNSNAEKSNIEHTALKNIIDKTNDVDIDINRIIDRDIAKESKLGDESTNASTISIEENNNFEVNVSRETTKEEGVVQTNSENSKEEIRSGNVMENENVSRETISEENELLAELGKSYDSAPIPENELIENVSRETKEVQLEESWSIEKFIGEKIVSVAGIGILVLGIFFIVKWAIDRNLLSDAAKIMLGIVCGTLLSSIAHKLSKKYRAFSSILAGGGVAVFYFSIYQAFQSYHLLSQTIAFACMILITAFSVIMSLYYDKKELAILVILGGFFTPFLVIPIRQI